MKRAAHQVNKRIDSSSGLSDLLVQDHLGPLSTEYLLNIEKTLNKAIDSHPRTLAIRVDLRFPSSALYNDDMPYMYRNDDAVITRFIQAIKARLDADIKKKKRERNRVHDCQLRYVWVREQDSAPLQHYHVLLLLNADTYNCLGSFQATSGNLASRIKASWASALGIPVEELGGCVHFPENPTYLMNRNSVDFGESYASVYHRVSYMAKLETKRYGGHTRHFGCSSR